MSRPEVLILRGGREQARSLPLNAPHVSRSYSDPLAAVACFDAPVGVDIERLGPVGEDFCESICTPEERRRMAGADPEAIVALWSSKEALAKALGDALDYDPRRLASPMFWPDGAAGRWRVRPLELPDGYVGWLCWANPATAI